MEDSNPYGSKDYYLILGVAANAEDVVIRAAYKALAQRYHPDRRQNPAAFTRMTAINEAYEVLSEPGLRQRYDSHLRQHGAHFPPALFVDISSASELQAEPALATLALRPAVLAGMLLGAVLLLALLLQLGDEEDVASLYAAPPPRLQPAEIRLPQPSLGEQPYVSVVVPVIRHASPPDRTLTSIAGNGRELAPAVQGTWRTPTDFRIKKMFAEETEFHFSYRLVIEAGRAAEPSALEAATT